MPRRKSRKPIPQDLKIRCKRLRVKLTTGKGPKTENTLRKQCENKERRARRKSARRKSARRKSGRKRRKSRRKKSKRLQIAVDEWNHTRGLFATG